MQTAGVNCVVYAYIYFSHKTTMQTADVDCVVYTCIIFSHKTTMQTDDVGCVVCFSHKTTMQTAGVNCVVCVYIIYISATRQRCRQMMLAALCVSATAQRCRKLVSTVFRSPAAEDAARAGGRGRHRWLHPAQRRQRHTSTPQRCGSHGPGEDVVSWVEFSFSFLSAFLHRRGSVILSP